MTGTACINLCFHRVLQAALFNMYNQIRIANVRISVIFPAKCHTFFAIYENVLVMMLSASIRCMIRLPTSIFSGNRSDPPTEPSGMNPFF